MNVKQLIAALQQCDADAEIFIEIEQVDHGPALCVMDTEKGSIVLFDNRNY